LRAQPHGGLDRAVFHGRWDHRTQRQFSRVWRRVRLGAARLPVVRLSHSATCAKCAAIGRGNVRTTFAIRKLTATRPRSRHRLTASSERATTRPEARIARALSLSPAHSKRVQAVMAIGCRKYRDSDWCSDACRERASHARHAGVRQTFIEVAGRSASRVHPLPPLVGTPPPATAMSPKRPLLISPVIG